PAPFPYTTLFRSLGQHVDAQRARHVAAQRGREPELVVVAAFGIEADDERRLAEPVGERVDVRGQIRAAAFLAGLDQDHAARVRDALVGERAQRAQRAEHRVAVVRAAAAVELAVAEHRRPRGEAFGPTGELGLL